MLLSFCGDLKALVAAVPLSSLPLSLSFPCAFAFVVSASLHHKAVRSLGGPFGRRLIQGDTESWPSFSNFTEENKA